MTKLFEPQCVTRKILRGNPLTRKINHYDRSHGSIQNILITSVL